MNTGISLIVEMLALAKSPRIPFGLLRVGRIAVRLSLLMFPGWAFAQSLPDMVVASVSYDASTALFSAVIKNQGAVATPSGVAIPVAFLVDGTAHTWASGGGPLAAGASQTISSAAGPNGGGPYTIPGGGLHTIAAAINTSGHFAESDTTNNSLFATIGPDVIIASASISYDSGTGIFSAKVTNQGALGTPSGVAIPVSFLVDGTAHTWASGWSSLAAGATETVTSAAGPAGGGPYNIPTGAHTITANVNDSGSFAETDTTNNSLSQSVSLAPDIIVHTLSYNSSTGGFSSTIINQGTAATPSGVAVEVAYSVDGINQTWASVAGPIPAGTSLLLSTGSSAGTYSGGPYTILVGSHTLGAVANSSNTFTESDTTNNTYSAPVTASSAGSPLPDIIVTALAYDTATGLFTATIKNKGSAATPSSVAIPVAFSIDGVFQAWASGWGPLAAGASQPVSSAAGPSGSGPYTLSSDTHMIAAVANRANNFSELNTTNNTLAQTMSVGETPSISSFSDTIGVNIHIHNNWGGDAYTSVSGVEYALSYANIRHARDLMINAVDVANLQNINAVTGTTYDIFIGSALATTYSYISSYSNIVDEVEGLNEPENFFQTYGGKTGIYAAAPAQSQLWSAIKSASNTQNITVDGPALGNPLNAATVGNISAHTDQVSVHVYPPYYGTSGESTFNTMQTIISESMPMAPNYPTVITEGGWWTAPAVMGTTEAAQAKLTLSFLLDAYLQGVTRSYLYELLDEHVPTPSNTTATMAPLGSVFGPITFGAALPNIAPGTTVAIKHDGSNYMWGTVYSYNKYTGATAIRVTKEVGSGTYSSWSVVATEDNFGLFHWDGTNVTPKAAATALHNLATILADPSGSPGFLPGTKAYTLAGLPSTGRSLVFKRSDGAFMVALWRDDPIWDNNGNEISVTPATVTLMPTVAPSSMSVFDATVGTTVVSMTTAASISVSLGDTPQFVLIQ